MHDEIIINMCILHKSLYNYTILNTDRIHVTRRWCILLLFFLIKGHPLINKIVEFGGEECGTCNHGAIWLWILQQKHSRL
jgi:hypothetical protein